MKKIYLACLIIPLSLLTQKVLSQNNDPDLLSAEMLRQGRLVYLGKESTWKRSLGSMGSIQVLKDASHDAWEPVNLSLGKGELPNEWNGLSWFKRTIRIDSTLYGAEVALFGILRGAAEIYLNGELIGKAGTIGKDATTEESADHFEPIVFHFSETEEQTLMIKYSNFDAKKMWHHSFVGINLYIGFSKDTFTVYKNYKNNQKEELNRFNLIFGFLFALTILHLIFFLYDPEAKANLTCSLFFLSLSGIFLSGVLFFSDNTSAQNYVNYNYGEAFSMIVGGSILPFFLYDIILKKINWLPLIVMGFGIVCMVPILLDPYRFQSLHNIFFIVSMLIGVGIVFYGRIKLRIKGLRIVIVFFIISFFLLLPGLLNGAFGILILWGNQPVYMNYAAVVAALGYSFFLARKVALTNRQLKTELIENERLVEQKLNVEKEKQILIERQKEQLEKEVADRTLELRNSLENLKTTQTQLIQQEKLASLGELTAGIAHEIQNPLNFVNNFSEVSNEMIKEILDTRHKTKDQSMNSEEDEILNDIAQNLEKINDHGKRADAIVKGMLQHSRTSSGSKEPTDINALCDEYLRLAFHGLRAKDKSFNAKFETDFDSSIPKLNVVPQDIGRVVLNLINNAFYAVNVKTQGLASQHYEPTVTVSTKYLSPSGGGKGVVISIKDNGPGIPEHIKEKIFQPFFTTKPTGQGTGLGLSLSYDIVKAHGGELKVETKENQGSEFIIQMQTH